MIKQSSTLYDLHFEPDSFQVIKINKLYDEQHAPGSLAGLYFKGVFDQPTPANATLVNMINLDMLKVYFTNREPTKDWGYPTQMDDLYTDTAIQMSQYSNPMYVTIANPSHEALPI